MAWGVGSILKRPYCALFQFTSSQVNTILNTQGRAFTHSADHPHNTELNNKFNIAYKYVSIIEWVMYIIGSDLIKFINVVKEAETMAITAKMLIEASGEADEVARFYQQVFNKSTLQEANSVPQPAPPKFDVDDDKKKQKIVNAMKQFNQHGILLIVSVLSAAKEYGQREDLYSYASFSDIKQWYEEKELKINERQISNRVGALNKQTSKLEIAPVATIFKDSFETNVRIPVWVDDVIIAYANEISADEDTPEKFEAYTASAWHKFLCELYEVKLITDDVTVHENSDEGLDALRNFVSAED